MKFSVKISFIFLYCIMLLIPALCLSAELPLEPPLVNPLGDLKLYTRVEYREAYPINLRIPGDGKGYETLKVYGDYWKLEAPYQKSKEEAYQNLVGYITSLGGEIFHQDENKLLLARLSEDGGKTWWVDLAFHSKGYQLSVYLVRNFTLEKPINLEFSKEGRKKINFYHDTNGEHYQTLVLDAPPGEFWMNISSQEKVDEYSRDSSFKRVFKQASPQRYRLADIPQDAGHYLWEIMSSNNNPPGTMTLHIDESGTLPAIQRSGELGSLLIKNIAKSFVFAEPEGSVKISHPEVSTIPVRGDLTPDGGSLLMLPPGFWKLSISPPDNKAVKRVEAHMIPVRPGEQTVVDWPAYVTRAFGMADSTGGIEITGTQIAATEGEIRFNLVGEEAKSLNLQQAKIDVMEGVEKGRILSLAEVKIPPDIVLLLDSSGSMKGQMQTALDATREFINGLPENTRVRIIDFDTEAKLLPGETKKAVLASLGKVRADGATALYDSVLAGLKLLKESRRPSLVLFTDGMDANWNDTGPGSKATQKELLEAVGPAKVPVFTIGFGKGHDRDTLNRLASVSGGLYFSADNAQALGQTFATILESVVNSYLLRYARPEQASPSDVPVIQLVLDTSGSMGESISLNEGVSRLDSLKEILRDFIQALPDQTLVSIQSFSDDSLIRQVATSDKNILLRSIGMLQQEGGTKIVTATDAALRSLRAIPSTQRYLVFVTDEAISLSAEDREIFDTLLGKIRDEGIKSLWIGTGLGHDSAKAAEAFAHAADLSSGRFVMEDDPAEIDAQFKELSTVIQKEAPGSKAKTNLRLTISQRDANGRVHSLAASALAELSSLPSRDDIVAPKMLSYEFKPMPPRYDPKVSALVSGDSTPREATVINKRIPLDVQAANKACTFSVGEALYLSRLRSVDAPSKQRFLALTMEFSNILPEQEVLIYPDGSDHPAAWLGGGANSRGRIEHKIPSYLIPDLQRHLYLQLNNSLMLPVSTTTWLAEAPLILPGERSVLVRPDSPVKGTAVFLIPDEQVDQASLHFYDIRYGHVDLALVGEFAATLDINELPPGPPVKLSDSFSLALKGYVDQGKIENVQAPEGTLFRIIDLNLQSNVQALLDIDPFARFWLQLRTAEGSVQFPLHGVTSLLPLGFWHPTMFAPGSDNHIRLAFQVPTGLAGKNAGALVVDVKGGGVVLPLGKDVASRPEFKSSKAVNGDGIDVVINATGSLTELNGEKGDWRVVDLTLIDKQDGEATRLGGVFALHRDDADGREWRFASPDEMEKRKKGLGKFSTGNKPVIELQAKTHAAGRSLLTGLTSQSVVPDGGERRGIMVFRMPDQDDSGYSWQLRSDWFPDLAVPINEAPYTDKSMLRARVAMDSQPSGDEKKLQEALFNAVREYRARAGAKPGRHAPAKITLDSAVPPGREIPVPSLVLAGAERFRAINNIESLKKAVEKLPWLPGADLPWGPTMSPEALFTQGWGTDDDIARAAEVVVTRMGYAAKREIVKLSAQGKKILAEQVEPLKLNRGELPAISYVDNQGQAHVLVSPFLKDLSEIGELATLDSEAKIGKNNSVELRVEAEVMPVSGERSQMTGKIATALAGGDGKQKSRTVILLKTDLDREQISRDPADLVYVEGLDAQGEYYTVVLEGPGGQVVGEGKLYKRNEMAVALRIVIRFRNPFMTFEHVRPLAEDEVLTGLFQTLGMNLPDLPQKSAEVLEDALQKASKPGDPDDLSALRWYTHTAIARFLVGQTKMEKDFADRLRIMTGRTAKPRVIVMNVSRTGSQESITATIDLVQAGNEIHSGTDEAQRAFRIVAGLSAARLEESVLGSSGYGVLNIWDHAPEGTQHFWITNSNRRDATKILSDLNYPEAIVNHIKDSRQFMLFSTSPTIINGIPRWGWLEIDPKSYEIVSVLDNGLHGGIVEYDLNTWYSEAQLHMFGAMLGVSTSVWAVSSFSLIIGDYGEIMKSAEEFVRGIAKNLETFKQNLGKPTMGTAKMLERGGAPQQDSGGSNSPVSVGTGKGIDDITYQTEEMKIKVGQTFMGFAQGFEMGVNKYFGN